MNENIKYNYKLAIINSHKKQKGITLIALVITIIVLLILAGVTINMIVGQNGIFKKATDAKEETKQQTILEAWNLLNAESTLYEQTGKEGLEEKKIKSKLEEAGITFGENSYPTWEEFKNGNSITIKEKELKYSELYIGKIVNPIIVGEYNLPGNYTLAINKNGKYKIQCFGAKGGSHNGGIGGNGAYTEGIIELNNSDVLHIYVGGKGNDSTNSTAGYNGGGYSTTALLSGNTSSGGGATDVRLSSSLASRIMVASGGSGGEAYNGNPGGGLTGITSNEDTSTKATQTNAGENGNLGSGAITSEYSGAGGGYYRRRNFKI